MEGILERESHAATETVLEIITTEDASHTLYSPMYNETYHSKHGAIQESMHVFIKHGLEYVLTQKNNVKIFEMGLGTGLNAILSLQTAREHNAKIEYHGLEKHPIPEEIAFKLNYFSNTNDYYLHNKYIELHSSPWNEKVPLAENFHLVKYEDDMQHFDFQDNFYDLVYQDAFAPAIQPDLWNEETVRKMFAMLKTGGVLVTYSAQGQFKRNLKSAGFEVERLPGPIGKREMTRAVKP